MDQILCINYDLVLARNIEFKERLIIELAIPITIDRSAMKSNIELKDVNKT